MALLFVSDLHRERRHPAVIDRDLGYRTRQPGPDQNDAQPALLRRLGPGIGWVKADSGNRNVDMFAWQVGADLDYRIGQLNLGLGARWQDTVNKTVATGQAGADNWLVQAKVGVAF